MPFIQNIFKRLRTGSWSASRLPASGPADEALRREFKLRYIQFRRLLNANDKVLKTIAELEAALADDKPFGMSLIRSRCALLFANVFQIIQQLNVLGSGRHQELHTAFERIRGRITPILEETAPSLAGPPVLDLEAVGKNHVEAAGVKMANLGTIAQELQVAIPPGFVITATAYHRFMTCAKLQEEINQRIQSHAGQRLDQLYELSSILQQLVMGASVPEEVATAIHAGVQKLKSRTGAHLALAVRSSSVTEDLPGLSFAGQYRSLLNVNPANIIDAYKEVVAGKYSVTAMSYRLQRGLRDEDVIMGVGCLQMVDSVAGGVVYTRNPLDIRDDTLIVNAVWGLPKMVVDGRSPADQFVLARQWPHTVLARQIATKTVCYRCLDAEGLCREDLDHARQQAPAVDDAQLRELARLALAIETYYGQAQDIEWALDVQTEIVILQCRPLSITTPEEARYTNAGQPLPVQPTGEDILDPAVLLQGTTTASRGVAAGSVRRLEREADSLEFTDGEVMVIRQSLPVFAPLMSRAAAVIAEYGSISSHLANVAREYQVPALFSAPGGMEKLSNGQVVTVDADSRRVYTGRVERLLVAAVPRPHLMANTPVYNVLSAVMPHVAPLTLLNPDDSGFMPQNCTSLHDIVRYCHEHAVREMFDFGHKHEFPRRSAKQLVVDVPMQWWILNLDDGFAREVDGPRVQLQNITSIPMLALWHGINKVPWQGPPPLDGRGFLSVMFEATRNTALIPDMRSQYAQRNYFMIAKNYCSLTSRFGFHFATVESYVSERIAENYIIFRFKGGAADDVRKVRRVHLIAGVLEDIGFSISITADALRARFEDYSPELMEHRLNIIGYLIMHTRQLDMVMSSNARVEHYRSKLTSDIQTLFHTTA